MKNWVNSPLARLVSRQLLLAVGYLHEAGVVHGGKISGNWCFERSLIDPSGVDIHPGDVLLRLPQVDKMTPDAVNDIFRKPRLETVTRRAGDERGPEVPEYIVRATLSQDVLRSLHEVQLIDLGAFTESQTLCIHIHTYIEQWRVS